MSTLGNINIRVDRLPKENFVKGKDGAVYCNITIAINDESRFGNNIAATVPQTKEEREAKKAKQYIGNGSVKFTLLNNGGLISPFFFTLIYHTCPMKKRGSY